MLVIDERAPTVRTLSSTPAEARVTRSNACVLKVYIMRRSNQMKRILREGWAHFLPCSRKRGR